MKFVPLKKKFVYFFFAQFEKDTCQTEFAENLIIRSKYKGPSQNICPEIGRMGTNYFVP